MTDDFVNQTKNANNSYPESWKPDPGDFIVGTVLGYDEYLDERWGKKHICTLEVEDATEEAFIDDRASVWLTHKVLLQEFSKQKPKPGERIGIKYHGPHETKEYHQYSLRVDRDQEDQEVPDFSVPEEEEIQDEMPVGQTTNETEIEEDDIPF